ncbi:TPA: hypothetical protein NJY08_004771 [Salmonella enterica subsp. enterica serovar Typhi str. AG3]|nr:hypothetical protein [Salmonella enterica subsp. enterica serovar Typhi str. AG3]
MISTIKTIVVLVLAGFAVFLYERFGFSILIPYLGSIVILGIFGPTAVMLLSANGKRR